MNEVYSIFYHNEPCFVNFIAPIAPHHPGACSLTNAGRTRMGPYLMMRFKSVVLHWGMEIGSRVSNLKADQSLVGGMHLPQGKYPAFRAFSAVSKVTLFRTWIRWAFLQVKRWY